MANTYYELFGYYEQNFKNTRYVSHLDEKPVGAGTKDFLIDGREAGNMKVTSEGIVNGFIEDRFGKRGTEKDEHGIPTRSLPLTIEGAPEGTKTFALFLEDKDAVPVCGFAWIHWLAANIKKTRLEENESLTATDYVQGTTSWHGVIGANMGIGKLDVAHYGGMTPPNAPHVYELHVYALDTELDLKPGFYMNELYHAIQGHVLDMAVLCGVYKS